AAGGVGDVFPDQRIFDPGFPSRRDRLAKIADRKLVEHYTESINIRRRGRRLPREHFRGQVHERPSQGRSARIAGLGDTQVRDAQGREPRRLDQRRAAKVGDFGQPAAMGRRLHQNIAWFQVLVQYAGGVRGRYRPGDIGEQVQPNPQRNPGQSSLALGPLREVWTPILAFEEERVSVESEYRSEEHTSELQSRGHLVCRLLLEKKKKILLLYDECHVVWVLRCAYS